MLRAIPGATVAPGLAARIARVRGVEIPGIRGRELRLLAGAVVLGVLLRVVFVAVTRHAALAGDELEYDLEARLFAAGHLFWSTFPYGIAHASALKAPGYTLWLGVLYSVLGHHPAVVEALQGALLGPCNIVLTYLLGRRLFGARAGLVACWVVAVYPFAWQYEVRLYSESIATPLTLGVVPLFLDREVSVRRAVDVGVLTGLLLLVRPTSVFLLPGVLVAVWLRYGFGRGLRLAVVALACAVVVVVPWTIRNAVVEGGLVPISLQDGAGYGTFNAQAASDPVWPFAWRPDPPSAAALLDPRVHRTELQLRSMALTLQDSYISAHPFSVVEAFFWNGLSRLWDVRRPARPMDEVKPEGRSRFLTIVGLCMYYLLAPLALACLGLLWRRRRELAWPLAAMALGASVVFTIDAGTRYRAPLEPLIVVLACAVVLARGRGSALAADTTDASDATVPA
jgi:4-amino-4-deoxy-L-arabinose transferase-like glycosyltransferase